MELIRVTENRNELHTGEFKTIIKNYLFRKRQYKI
jgi:hypothetical protein